MADKILVNTDLLEKCANELKQAASGFGDAASILAGLNTSEEWWTKMGRFSALKLQDEGSSAQMGDAGAAVRSLAGVMRRYDGRATTLGNNVSKAASMFKELEKSLYSKSGAQNAGSGAKVGGAVTSMTSAASLSVASVAANYFLGKAAMYGLKGLINHFNSILGKGGIIGKTVSTGWSVISDLFSGKMDLSKLAKYLYNGKDIVAKWIDLNKRYKKLSNLGKDYAKHLKLKEMFGLNKYWSGKDFASTLSRSKNGLKRFKANFSKQFKSTVSNPATWITSAFFSGINNIAQHYEGLKTGAVKADQVVVEWAVETGVDVIVGAGTTALASAGLAAIGVTGAPVIVVGAAAVGISCAADWAFKMLTGSKKGIAETIGDAAGYGYKKYLKPAAKKVGKAIKKGAEKVGKWLGSLFS